MQYSRRDLGKIALASVPLARAFGAKMIDSKIDGVQIGAITYSFNTIASPDPEAIIRAYVEIGLGEAELMSNHCEALAGAPPMPVFGRRRRCAWRPGAADRGAAGRAASRAGETRAMARHHQRRHLEGRHQEVQRRRRRGRPALLQHAGQHEGRGHRVRLQHGQGARREGHHHQHHPDHGEAHRADRGQAQDDGRLSRPRRHQRPQPDRHARELRLP